MRLLIRRIPSPIGRLVLVCDGETLLAADFADCEQRLRRLLRRHWGEHRLVPERGAGTPGERLQAYFGGELHAIDGIRVRTGGSAFQRVVWAALRAIPVGSTTSYGALARSVLGDTRASRAVGLANGANPISVVVPCHRVIGADGTLRGYAGGLDRKRWLLRHEGAWPGDAASTRRRADE